MHFHSPQRLPFYPHRPHTRRHVFSPPPPPTPTQPFFPHCRSSARSRRSLLCISTIAAAMSTPEGAFSVFPLDAAVTAPAGALSVFHHYRCSDCSPQERYLYFPTAPAVIAPAGALSVFPYCRSSARSSRSLPPTSLLLHYRSSACSRRNLLYIPHYRSSACPGRILLYISPLTQQWPLPQELSLSISTAAAVTAPAGALPLYFHCRSSDRSRRSTSRFVPTTAVVSAPAGALSLFPLPQQWPLPQELSLSISTAAAVTAPAGALPVFPHYRCSECSPQERYPYFLTAPAVSAPARALPKFPHCRSSARSSRKPFPPSPLLHPPPPPLFPHCRSSACSSRSLSPPPLPPSIFSLPQQCLLQQEPLPPPLPFPTAPTPP